MNMKRPLLAGLLAVLVVGASTPAFARNTVSDYSIEGALKGGEGADKIDPEIRLYFADQEHPQVASSLGGAATNKKTSALGVSDEYACRHVFLSALLQLQQKTRELGGDAVINIQSNYQNKLQASATRFTCGAGAVIAGVALKGEIVKLQK